MHLQPPEAAFKGLSSGQLTGLFNMHLGISFLFKKGKKSKSLQNRENKNVEIGVSKFSLYFPYVLAGFPLVSDGPMVWDLCN